LFPFGRHALIGLIQEFRALICSQIRPGTEGPLGRFDGPGGVAAVPIGRRPDRFTICRVENGKGGIAGGIDPLPVNV